MEFKLFMCRIIRMGEAPEVSGEAARGPPLRRGVYSVERTTKLLRALTKLVAALADLIRSLKA